MSDFDDAMSDAAGLLMDVLGTRGAITWTDPTGHSHTLTAVLGAVQQQASETSFGSHTEDDIVEQLSMMLVAAPAVRFHQAVIVHQHGDDPFTIVEINVRGSRQYLRLERTRTRQIRAQRAERV